MLDIEGALRDWGNAQSDLVGSGMPLGLGFHPVQPRSPGRECYATLDVIDGGDGLTAEGVTAWAKVTATVYSVSDKEAARRGALALVGALAGITQAQPVVASRGVRLIMAASTKLPEYDDGGEVPAYRVETQVHACSA